jgi:hypothetical protein
MSENTETGATPRRGGWPKGKPRARMTPEAVTAAADRAVAPPRNPMVLKMKAQPNWEGDDFAGVGLEGSDRLKIPQEIVDALWRDGIALQWITRAVRGMEMPQEMSRMTKGGWTPVHQEDFDGILDGLFMPKGDNSAPITVDDCLLVARPTELQKKAKRAEVRDAQLPLRIAEDQIGHGIPGVTGSNHKSVKNTINRSVERIEIPE